MSAIADLSPFVPQTGDDDDLGGEARPMKAIGWLSAGAAFAEGHSLPGLVDRLREAARAPRNLTKGWQPCPFCSLGEDGPPYEHDRSGTVYLGTGEIHVEDGDVAYIAPTLIVHYIEAHQYLPPPAFIDAVLGA